MIKHFKIIWLLSCFCSPLVAEILPATIQEISSDDSHATIIEKAVNVLPSQRQLDYHQREYSGFIHFGPNTFTRAEWGSGMEDPSVFNPKNVDTDQWCDVLKKAGMKTAILTVKHHDGFVLYPSRYTTHGIMSSPFKSGKGDILRMLVDSCRAQGLKIGVYLSPADLFQIESPDGLYGNLSKYRERTIPKQDLHRPFTDKRKFTVNVDDYNEYFMSQLFELLTEYGPIHEVWFDGAHPKKKGGQTYVRDDWYKLVHTLAPNAVIFGGPDARWIGNEQGGTRASEWSVIPIQKGKISIDRPDNDIGSRERLFDSNYTVYGKNFSANQLNYIVAEVDTSIRDGWFYRDDIHQKVRSADEIFDIYERTVGGNSVFLLNVPPTPEGRFSQKDIDVLIDSGNRIKNTYEHDLLLHAAIPKTLMDDDKNTFWQTTNKKRSFEIHLPEPKTMNRFVLQEAIATHSQRIEEHALDAWIDNEWREIAVGTTVGYKKILRFNDVNTDKFRIRIPQSRSQATVSSVSAHYYLPPIGSVKLAQTKTGKIEIELQKNDFSADKDIVVSSTLLANIASFFGIHITLKEGNDRPPQMSNLPVIYYTTDGSEPSLISNIYKSAFEFNAGIVKARAFKNGVLGPINQLSVSIQKDNLNILSVSSEQTGAWYQFGFGGTLARNAFDNDPDTYWQTASDNQLNHPHHIAVDLGRNQKLAAFTYLPRQGTLSGEGMIASGYIETSNDNKSWVQHDSFSFGNIINDPVKRTHYFDKPIAAKYIRIVSLSGAKDNSFAGAAEIGFLQSKAQ